MSIAGTGLLLWTIAPLLAGVGPGGFWGFVEWTGFACFIGGGVMTVWTWLQLRRLQRA